jgi:hypothetical protein
MVISNEELVASNPLYHHLIDNDPGASYPWTENLEQIAEEEERSLYRAVTLMHYIL